MIGIIVTGHNRFAEGMTSTVEMIAGAQKNYESVNFLEGTSPDALNVSLREAVNSVKGEDGIIIFTDLKGGTPFQQAVMIAMNEDNVEVLTGTNIAMLLEGVLMRGMSDNVEILARKLIDTGLSQISLFCKEDLIRHESEVDEDGI